MFEAILLMLLAQTPVSAETVRQRDITVFPNGQGLPAGKGRATEGKALYKEKCAECHNEKGEGREAQYPALAGGTGSLATNKPLKTVGSYWPYATTVWDTIFRAMPYDKPRSLAADEVYAITAVILHWNGIIAEDFELNEKTLPQVKMPNRDGFVPDKRPHQKTKR
jgi:S-disulfanyl-L-cysteine oxidoreductase SoxD